METKVDESDDDDMVEVLFLVCLFSGSIEEKAEGKESNYMEPTGFMAGNGE